MKKRIIWMDIAKGLGALLIVAGHCVYFGGYIHNWIFSFHVPLFFILSGLNLRDEPLREAVRKRNRTLIKPYLGFMALGLVITFILPPWRSAYLSHSFIRSMGHDLYLAVPDWCNVSSVWFLVCLFFTVLVFELLLKISCKKRYGILTIMLLSGFAFGRFKESFTILPAHRLPWNLDVVLVSTAFLAFGYEWKPYCTKHLEKFKSWNFPKKLVTILFLFSITTVTAQINGRVNLHGMDFNNPFLFILGVLAGALMTVTISAVLENSIVSGFFQWVGRHSLEMMGVQAILIRLYILAVNIMTGNNYELYHLPPIYAIGAVWFVTTFSLIAVYAISMVKAVQKGESNS